MKNWLWKPLDKGEVVEIPYDVIKIVERMATCNECGTVVNTDSDEVQVVEYQAYMSSTESKIYYCSRDKKPYDVCSMQHGRPIYYKNKVMVDQKGKFIK